MSGRGIHRQARTGETSRAASGQDSARPADREASRTYSGASGKRRSSVPGYDRERDPTATTQAGLNIFGMPLLGAATGAGVGAEMDATVLGAGIGAAAGLLIALAVIRLFASRPMGR
jgi:hypothetical protein